MKVKLIITLVWVIFGLTNVFWAGSIDKRFTGNSNAPITILFIGGPIGSIACAAMEIIMFSVKAPKNSSNPLDYIYDLGKK